jgi:hypothetical protein
MNHIYGTLLRVTFAMLIGDRTGGFTGRLAGGLAFAATDCGFVLFIQIARDNRFYMLHYTSSPMIGIRF